MTQLPIAPAHFWLLATLLLLVLASGVVFSGLTHSGQPRKLREWDRLPVAVRLGLMFLGLAWIGQVLLGLGAAFSGLWTMISPAAAIPGNPAPGGSLGGLGAGALVAVFLGAPFVIWGTMIRHRTLGFQREGHMTDRISKAVEQLGAERTVKRPPKEGSEDGKPVELTEANVEVRIGGLLSLQRIAEDSMRLDGGRDHIRVMQIICAYLRQNSPALDLSVPEQGAKPRKPRIDLQVAVDVVRRRSKKQCMLEADGRYRLELSDTDFSGLNLAGADLSGAQCNRSRFEKANLNGCILRGTNMTQCLLYKCEFQNADMNGTKMVVCTIVDTAVRGFLTARRIRVAALHADLGRMQELPSDPLAITGDEGTVLPEPYASIAKEALEAFADDRDLSSDDQLRFVPFGHWYRGDNAVSSLEGFWVHWHKKNNFDGWPYPDMPKEDPHSTRP